MKGSRNLYEMLPAPGFLADLVLLVHGLIVAFGVFGLVLFIIGGIRGWHWVCNPWVRWLHLVTIGFVVVQAWLGQLCPLTIWEHELRRAAGQSAHDQGFIEYWVNALIFHDLPGWVFLLGYTVFGVLVAATWCWLPPCQRSSSPKDSVR
ncbi:DUF2784 domain-containing protein [Vreelandella utahensis]|uniref:DUF2784 domain-containing protein n=1 Tax=Vreelandella halophila TaxID=86177 RepID=UPI001FEB61EC|nr:DUF2784 domain-containing protein [Halomonas utahensis]